MSIRDTLAVQAKNLLNRGFFHILGSTLTNKLIVFASNILIVRFLTQDEYGVFSYANSIYSIVLLFTGLGLMIIAGRLPRRSTLSCHTVPRRAASC